jgi:hypothetical protein
VRGRFQRTRHRAIEHLCIISLAGPAAEELFCGPITDSGDKVDLRIARGYLEPYFPAIALGAHLHRLRAAAQRLVIDAKPKIKLIADALIAYGSLTGDEVYELAVQCTAATGLAWQRPHHRQPESVMGRTPPSHTKIFENLMPHARNKFKCAVALAANYESGGTEAARDCQP